MSSQLPDSGPLSEEGSSGPRVPVDVAGGALSIVFGFFFLWNSGEDMRDWIWPRTLSQLLMVLGAVLILRGLTASGRSRTVPVIPRALRGLSALKRGDADVLVFALMIVGYVALAPRLGFWLMTFLVVSAAATLLDLEITRRKRVIAVLVALAVCLVGYLLFEVVFYVPFPSTPGAPF